MGNLHTDELARAALDGLRLETAVRTHLRYNHFPPIPDFMVAKAITAINLLAEDDLEESVDISPARHRRCGRHVPAQELAETLHLWPFVETRRAQLDRDNPEAERE